MNLIPIWEVREFASAQWRAKHKNVRSRWLGCLTYITSVPIQCNHIYSCCISFAWFN
jgi:hypothetical protein